MLTLIPETDPILRQLAGRVDIFDAELHDFVAKLNSTMLSKKAVGIAAPQVGVSKRIIIVEGIGELINPILCDSEGSQLHKEGCLTFPGMFAKIQRYRKIKVSYQDKCGIHICNTFVGFTATVIQHEIDHLNGKLFIEYLSPIGLALAKKNRKP